MVTKRKKRKKLVIESGIKNRMKIILFSLKKIRQREKVFGKIGMIEYNNYLRYKDNE